MGGKRTLGRSPGPIQVDLRLRVRTLADLIEIDTAAIVAAIHRQPVVSHKPPNGQSHNGYGCSSGNLRAGSHSEATGPAQFGESTSAMGREPPLAFHREADAIDGSAVSSRTRGNS